MWQSNGFIVIRNPAGQYSGVDNDAWPLELEEMNDLDIQSIHQRITDQCYIHYNKPFAILMTDQEEVSLYKNKCEEKGGQPVVLYCETPMKEPGFNAELSRRYALEENFIGYDYADKQPEYHSCIKNELLYHPFIYSFKVSQLNSAGLFSRYHQVCEFISEREKIMQSPDNRYLETGDFIVFKLFTVDKI